jgi:hypothetical protein
MTSASIRRSHKKIKINDDIQESLNRACENVRELTLLTQTKDAEILSLNCDITNQTNIIARQTEVIKNQISELHALYSEIIQYQFYKPHPKDAYLINFGHAKYRGWTYRQAISLRDGKKLCRWVLTKSTVDTEHIKEFKRYLRDVKFV